MQMLIYYALHRIYIAFNRFLKISKYYCLIETQNLIMMKKFTFLFLLFTASILLSCNTENIEENTLTNEDPNFSVSEYTNYYTLRTTTESCVSRKLIAGQNMDAGEVTVDFTDTDIIITYSTVDSDFTIDLTHLSVGNCDEQWVPTTGSGNPKVGKFEHSEPTLIPDVNTVIYHISLDYLQLNDVYCFAAHAEVTGPTGGETAWAQDFLVDAYGNYVDEDGIPVEEEDKVERTFAGNNWAMYVEANVNDCVSDNEEEQEPTTGYK